MSRPELLDRALSLLFPKRCVLCGEAVEYDDLTCGRCAPPRPGEERCPGCGKEHACSCMPGFVWGFDAVAYALRYEEGARLAAIRLKTVPDERAARFFAREMLRALDERYADDAFDLITAVPISEKGLEERGFNQAELLAGALGRLCGLSLCRGLLRREEHSLDQHELSRGERFENALRSYRLADHVELDRKSILLIDDIFTTGATVHACAMRLRQGGAARVCVLCATGVDRAENGC